MSPSVGVTGVSGKCTQVDNSAFPENRAFLSVWDQNKTMLTSFAIGNFTVLEDDKPCVIKGVQKVNNDLDPLAVSIIIDRSGSIYGQPTIDATNAAVAFVQSLGTSDSAQIINFSTTIKVSQGFTTNKSDLISAIQRTSDYEFEATSLYDAIGKGVEDVSKQRGRKLVIVMTDGADTSSNTYTVESIISKANQNGLAVYTIGIGEAEASVLGSIANGSSGATFSGTSSQLNSIYLEILTQLKNQVQISYRSILQDKTTYYTGLFALRLFYRKIFKNLFLLI